MTKPQNPHRRWRPRIAVRVALSAAMIAAFVLSGGALWMRMSLYNVQMTVTETLAQKEVAEILTAAEQDLLHLDDYSVEFFGELPYEVVDSTGSIISSSENIKPFETSGPIMPVPRNKADRLTISSSSPLPVAFASQVESPLAGQPIVITSGLAPGGLEAGGTYRVFVFITTDKANQAVAAIDPFLWGGVALATLLVGVSAAFAVRRALRPVEVIRRTAHNISAETPSARIALSSTDDELTALAVTINDMLDRLDNALKAQRRFSADAAHELRTPITSLLASLEIARTYPRVIDRDETLNHAIREGHRLEELTQDLLQSIAVIDGPMVFESCDIAHVIRAAILGFPPQGSSIRLTIDTDSEWVSASCAQLERALRNIVQNAFRHARTTVEVKSAIRGNWYEITVSNDGADIPAEVQEEIFRPFVRLDSARSRDEGGSGLGLPIARDTLERHHGTLSVQSANGTTTFILKLPLPIEKINDYLNNG